MILMAIFCIQVILWFCSKLGYHGSFSIILPYFGETQSIKLSFFGRGTWLKYFPAAASQRQRILRDADLRCSLRRAIRFALAFRIAGILWDPGKW